MNKAELEQQIRDAKGAHGAWKLTLAKAVETGELPKRAKDIACDDQCAFGEWLHGLKTDDAAEHPKYKTVVDAHANFHRIAGGVAEKIEAGDRAAAKTLLDSEDYQASTVALSTEMARWRASI